MLNRDHSSIRQILSTQRALMEGKEEEEEEKRRSPVRRSAPLSHSMNPRDASEHFSKDWHQYHKKAGDAGLQARESGSLNPHKARSTDLSKRPAFTRKPPQASLGVRVTKASKSPKPRPPREKSIRDLQGGPENRAEFAQRAKAWDADKMDTEKVVPAPYIHKFLGRVTHFRGANVPASPVGMTKKQQNMPAFRKAGGQLMRGAGATGVGMPHSKGRQIRDHSKMATGEDGRTIFQASVDLGRTHLLDEG